MPDDSFIEDDVELYAIDALGSVEMSAFEDTLATLDPARRAAVQARIAQTREAVARMSGELLAVPRPVMRRRILDAVRAHRTSAGPRHRAAAGGDRAGRRRLGYVHSRSARAAVASIAAVAAVIVGVIAGVLIGRATAPSVTQDQQVEAVISAPDGVVTRSPISRTSGSMIVVSSRSLNRAVILLESAPQPAVGRTYQLWLIPAAGKPRSAGVIPEVSARRPFVIDGLANARQIGMTLEPAGGSPQPTGNVLAAVRLADRQ